MTGDACPRLRSFRPVASSASASKRQQYKRSLDRAAERAAKQKSALCAKNGLPPANVQAHLESVELLLLASASQHDW